MIPLLRWFLSSRLGAKSLSLVWFAWVLSATTEITAAEVSQSAEHLAVKAPYAMDYLCYLPPGYAEKKDQRWPLVIFLHGQGARGSNVADVRKEGLAKLIEGGRQFPFVVVSPQCPEDEWWNLPAMEAFMDDMAQRYRIDPDRVYLTGLSMGGFGVWALAQRDPGRYAAIMPISGGGEPKWAPRLKDIPTWGAHGAKDKVVPIEREQEIIDAIKAAGGTPRYTVFPEGKHNVWDEFYANDELYTWLLAQNRRLRGPAPQRVP